MGFLYSQLFVTPVYPTTDFSGRTIIVTGSNQGLGKEAARHFVRLGASKVVLAVRNVKAGALAKDDIESSLKKKGVVEVMQLDLASNTSIKKFADLATSKLSRIDAVVENAGILTDKFTKVDGCESTIQVNVIGTFYLALLLLPKLKATAKEYQTSPTITILTSNMHGWVNFDERNEDSIFNTLNDSKNSKSFAKRYETSKLLEVLLVRHLAPMLLGSDVVLNMINPGLCHSGLADGIFMAVFKVLLARTTEVGSRSLVAAASMGSESHGKYIDDAKVNEGELSPFVRSDEGRKAGERVWKELKAILEKIQPGITANVTQ